MSKASVCGIALAFLSGCMTITPPTPEQLKKADYGWKMPLEEFNKLAQERLTNTLIDPNSLIFYGSAGLNEYWAADSSGTIFYGYIGCYDYNAKNRMGGYAGKSKQCLFLSNGYVLQRYVVEKINNGELYFIPALNRIDRKI